MISLGGSTRILKKSPVARADEAIHLVRGQHVMLDSDLAKIYSVPLKRLNEQVRRHADRFPKDFVFRLTRQEVTNLKSQIATSSLNGGRRTLPWVFTEHGAIMLATVLNSAVAVEASIGVVRAFVRLREMTAANGQLAQKLSELEQRLEAHDDQIANLFAAIRQLLAPPQTKKREIDFHGRETASRYGKRRKKTA